MPKLVWKARVTNGNDLRRRTVLQELFQQLSSGWLLQEPWPLLFLSQPPPMPFSLLLFFVLLPHHSASFPELQLFSPLVSSTQQCKNIIVYCKKYYLRQCLEKETQDINLQFQQTWRSRYIQKGGACVQWPMPLNTLRYGHISILRHIFIF